MTAKSNAREGDGVAVMPVISSPEQVAAWLESMVGCTAPLSDGEDHNLAVAAKLIRQQAAALQAQQGAVDVLRIPRSKSLDPIVAYFEDYGPGQGRITIACFGNAWTGAWGAMGDRTVRQFVADTDEHYLTGSLLQLSGGGEHHRRYTARIAAAVIEALAPATGAPR